MSSAKNQPNLAEIARSIFDDVFNTIIHKTILFQHRDHKMMLPSLDPTTKLLHCDKCNLPRLLDPPLAPKVRGATSEPPKDTVYCDKKPWCRAPGFDIYGNPFPRADVTGRPPTKKEREAAKNSSKKDGTAGNDTPASNEDGTAPPSPSADGGDGDNRKLEKGEKKASKIDEKLKKGEYVPWQTCPSCKRSLLVTRFAKHLEQCMRLSGRAASRNAMAKMGGTPAGSRGGTPGPSGSQEGRGEGGVEEEDEDEKIKGPGAVRKKVLKKGMKEKMKKDKDKSGFGAVANGKLKAPSSAAKKPPPTGPSSAAGEGKRDRDEMLEDGEDEGENVHVKKRQKLQRVESQASFGSASLPGSAVEMETERRESDADGDFVDYGGGDEGDD